MFEGVLVDALVAVELGVLVRVQLGVVDAQALPGVEMKNELYDISDQEQV